MCSIRAAAFIEGNQASETRKVDCLLQLPVFPVHCLVQLPLFPQTFPGDVFGPVYLFYAYVFVYVLVYQQLSSAIKY